MDGYNISLDSSQANIDGQTLNWNAVSGTWTLNGATIGTACSGSPFLIGTIYITPPYPATYVQLDLENVVPEKEEVSAGCSCKKCKEFFEYASNNQDDKTFICYACLHNL